MAKKKEEFETEEPKAESIATANILNGLEPQAPEDVAPPVEEPKHTNEKTSDDEKEVHMKASNSDAFMDVLNIKKKEIKSKKVNFLLTETNFNHLVELSEQTGASRNEIINRLINSCYQNADFQSHQP